MSDEEDKKLLHCSFCGKRQDEVKKIIAGPEVWICDECVTLCKEIIDDSTDDDDKPVATGDVPGPRELKEYLDEYVIGQEFAKQVVGVAVYNHYKRLQNPVVDDVELEKSNVLLMGPTGSGKTLLAQSIARKLGVPIAIADATSLTEAGYVGDDVETIITRLLQVADYDVEKAERGIIFIDEIDKKGRRGDSASITRDVSGEGVQQALLKIIEGTEVRVPPQGGRKHPAQEMVTVNTKNILFFVSGAFVDIEKVIEKRVSEKTSIGFGAVVRDETEKQHINEMLRMLEPEDLVKYGLIPELVGRLPVLAHLEELTEDQLIQVLTEPKNAVVKQFEKLFKLDNVELEFTQDALKAVANTAIERKTGARGLRSVIEQRLIGIQYKLPDIREEGANKVVVGPEVIVDKVEPTVIYESENGNAA